MKLSIIIPAYLDTDEKANKFWYLLLAFYKSMYKDEYEIIVIDDGSPSSYMHIFNDRDIPTLISTRNNYGVSHARNLGLSVARGEYIAFIDSDDDISDDYIQFIIDTINEDNPDLIKLSWETTKESIKEMKCIVDETHPNFPDWNTSVWNYVFKRSVIGDIRFDESLKFAEDKKFLDEIKPVLDNAKISYISEPMYFYNANTEDSLTERNARGEFDE